jgi:cytochrome c oxidase assembly protein subunit 15
MDFDSGFTLQRELGRTAAGDYLPFAALTAIHVVHRLAALIVLGALALLAWRLAASGDRGLRRFAAGLAALSVLQLATGLSNAVLDWPMAAALLHTGGAAALAVLLATLLARAHVTGLGVPQAAAARVHLAA